MHFDSTQKPDPAVCPRQFCFFWRPVNWHTQGRNQAERLYATEGECLCDFGVCTRLNPAQGDRDWYEPDEPDLEEAGLPWFFFINTPASLVRSLSEKYIAESEALWGKEHWQRRFTPLPDEQTIREGLE